MPVPSCSREVHSIKSIFYQKKGTYCFNTCWNPHLRNPCTVYKKYESQCEKVEIY